MGIVSYQIRPKKGPSQLIMVEVDDGSAGLPRRATSQQVSAAALEFQTVLKPLSALSKAVVDALKSTSPSELSVEFGIEVGGEIGIPIITKSTGKANFKVILKWKPGKGRGAEDDE
jgi:hypothetical protein